MSELTYKRTAVGLTKELEKAILYLRKTEEYCRCSYSEIMRMLMQEGVKSLAARYPGISE